jgi:nickel/cobalt exporter
MALFLGLVFGLLQGLRHAFEPDHVVAISTMLGEAQRTKTRVAYAAMWGLGHAAMLLMVGATLMLARAQLPSRLEAAFELAVSIMLIALGTRALAHAARRARLQPHRHRTPHAWRTFGPLTMGIVHGLAGSGALTALVIARLPSVRLGIVFMLLFGAGATIGMSLLAGIAGAPLSYVLRRRWGMSALLGTTGLVSMSLGVSWLGPALHHVIVAP